MARTITLKGIEWTKFIESNKDDPAAADAIEEVVAALAAEHARLLPDYKGSTEYRLMNTKLAITLTIPA